MEAIIQAFKTGHPYIWFALQFIIAFIAMCITETLWSLYIHNVRDENEHHAGLYNVGIIVIGGTGTCIFVNNHWMLIAAALGAYSGTRVSTFFYTKK